jgi:hypothetical protein
MAAKFRGMQEFKIRGLREFCALRFVLLGKSWRGVAAATAATSSDFCVGCNFV